MPMPATRNQFALPALQHTVPNNVFVFRPDLAKNRAMHGGLPQLSAACGEILYQISSVARRVQGNIMRIRTFIAAAAAVATLAGPSAALAEVVIAGNIPLTGPVAAYSGNYFKGFQLGLEETCAKLNVDCSEFKVDAQDNASQTQQAVSIAQRQMLESPAVVISGTSDASSAIGPFFDDKNVAHFMIAFDARIVEKGESRMRLLPNFKDESVQYLRLIDKLQPKKIFAMALNNSSNVEMFETVVGPEILNRHIDYTFTPFDFETSDFSNLALRAKEANADLYIVSGYSFQIYPLMKALRAYGIDASKIVVTMDFIDLLYNGTPKAELEGFYFTTPTFEIPGALPAADRFRAAYKAKYGADPSYLEAYAYDTAALIVTAYAKSGRVDEGSLLAQTPFEGVTGTIVFDEYGDIQGTTNVAEYTKDGVVEVK